MNKIAKMALAGVVMAIAAGCNNDKNKTTPPVASNEGVVTPKPYTPPDSTPVIPPDGGGTGTPMGPVANGGHTGGGNKVKKVTPSGGGSGKLAPAETHDLKGAKTYVVKSGDSLSKIAAHFYGKSTKARVEAIKKANKMKTDVVRIGQTLKIPAASTVKA